MKKNMVIILLFFTGSVLYASGDFIPSLPDGGERLSGNSASIVSFKYQDLSVQQIADFFKNEFKDDADINYHEIKESRRIVINDWGKSKWQRIIISENGDAGTMVTIKKYSWIWVIGTLIVRYLIGVFGVLAILLIVLNIINAIVLRSLANIEKKAKTEMGKQGS